MTKLVGDFDEDGLGGAYIDEVKLSEKNYLGLGKPLFSKVEQQIANGSFSNFRFTSDFDLDINELQSIDLKSSRLPYSTDIFRNLLFSIFLDPSHRKTLEGYLNEYIKKFRSDDLEIEQAKNYFGYTKQLSILNFVIKSVEQDFPLRNVPLNNEKIDEITKLTTHHDKLEKFRLIDTLLGLEQETENEESGIKIGIQKLDASLGISIAKVTAPKGLKSNSAFMLLEGKFKQDNIFSWRCGICRNHLKDTGSVTEFGQWVAEFSKISPLKCNNSHENWLSIEAERIMQHSSARADNSKFFTERHLDNNGGKKL